MTTYGRTRDHLSMPDTEYLRRDLEIAVRLARLKQQQADRAHERVFLPKRLVAIVLRNLAHSMRDHLRQTGCAETDRMLNYVAEAEHLAYLLTSDGGAHDLTRHEPTTKTGEPCDLTPSDVSSPAR